MNVGWVIDAGLFDHYRDQLIADIRAQGHEVKLIHDPKAGYNWDDEGCSYREIFPQDACAVVHGDIEIVSRISRERLWKPGVFATFENFACSSYYCHFGEHLLNNDYIMLPFGELRRCREFLFGTLGRDDKIFVRPDSPLKLFTGQITSTTTFDADMELMGFYDVPANALVVVSSPKSIVAEWRFIIADQTIVTGSEYIDSEKFAPKATIDPKALELAEIIASSAYQPERVWVADICRTDQGAYRLLEIGVFNCADLYACDTAAIVRAVSEVALDTWRQQV
ncbi:hypothetical protein Mal52_02860 [Symmachiella dynata]|uniref:ATP-grasp domain-containing protein n=1 Tax=Symmachiella dynata TaxID=2527995 RepID=A0A517ZHA4_9PLAN|nr:ATP-grasp domain-containing protein [Symmachiella dynata]QDU41832.1 hypothetical protein Mal52_02860 [Symmachiella dynata]